MKFPKFMIMNATDDLLGGGGGAPPAAPANPATPPAAPAAPAAKPTDPNDTTWKDGLPDDLKNDPTIKNLKDVPAALRMLLNAQKLIGKDKLVIPEPSATDEQWGEVMKKLGLPETVDKYDFKAPEGATPEFLKEFKEFAHKNAILPRQAEKFMGWFKERTEKALQEAETQDQHAFNSAVDGLKREWGTAYDRKIAEASGMFKTFTTEEERKELRELGFSNHPTVIKLMAKTAEALVQASSSSQAETVRWVLPQRKLTRRSQKSTRSTRTTLTSIRTMLVTRLRERIWLSGTRQSWQERKDKIIS
jgi:hypothetical protein